LGIALGSWIAPFVHLIGLRKQLPFYKRRIDLKLEPLQKMFRLIVPLIVGTTCIESRRLIDNFFASKLRVGSVTALAYGYKLIEFAYVAIAEPLAVVVLPYFSDLAIQKEHEKLTETLMTTLRTVILIFTPLGVCLFALRYPVVRLLFERGEFDTISTQLTVTALTYYSPGIISFAVDVILLRFFFSMSDTKTPAIMEIFTITMHVGIIYMLSNTMAHGSIALAFTLSKTIKVLVLYGLLKKKIDDIQRNYRIESSGSSSGFTSSFKIRKTLATDGHQPSKQTMSEKYKNLILVIFNEEQLRKYKEKYHSSAEVTLFGIANEMKTDARKLIESFDFLDFAETIMRQTDSTIPKSTNHHKDERLLKRI